MNKIRKILDELRQNQKQLIEREKLLHNQRRTYIKKYKLKLKEQVKIRFDDEIERIILQKRKNTIKIKKLKELLLKRSGGRNPDVKEVLDFYIKTFEERFKIVPHINYSVDGAIAKHLLKTYDKETLILLIKQYLSYNDPFIKKTGYLFKLLPTVINSLIVNIQKQINNNVKHDVKIDKIQLKEYKKLKEAGKVTGEEDWAKPFEELLKDEL